MSYKKLSFGRRATMPRSSIKSSSRVSASNAEKGSSIEEDVPLLQ